MNETMPTIRPMEPIHAIHAIYSGDSSSCALAWDWERLPPTRPFGYRSPASSLRMVNIPRPIGAGVP